MSTPLPPWIDSIEATRVAVGDARAAGKPIAIVPTMGALHEGHGRLIETAKADGGFVVATIFVNPTQFGEPADLDRYPRTPEADRELCGRAGADLIFAPTSATMYPRGNTWTGVVVPEVTEGLEGACRPGHFLGVATVVMKLFQAVGPDRAYFGRKDYQQWLVVRRMVADLFVPVEVRAVETVREPDGLAMSSRNRRLSAEGRRAALALSAGLRAAQAAAAGGERSADRVRQILEERIRSVPEVAIEYAAVADAETLGPLVELPGPAGAVALVAARVDGVRLIDNAPLA